MTTSFLLCAGAEQHAAHHVVISFMTRVFEQSIEAPLQANHDGPRFRPCRRIVQGDSMRACRRRCV